MVPPTETCPYLNPASGVLSVESDRPPITLISRLAGYQEQNDFIREGAPTTGFRYLALTYGNTRDDDDEYELGQVTSASGRAKSEEEPGTRPFFL